MYYATQINETGHHNLQSHAVDSAHQSDQKKVFVHEILTYLNGVRPPTNHVTITDITKHLETLPAHHPANQYRKCFGNLNAIFSANDLNTIFKHVGTHVELIDSEGEYVCN